MVYGLRLLKILHIELNRTTQPKAGQGVKSALDTQADLHTVCGRLLEQPPR